MRESGRYVALFQPLPLIRPLIRLGCRRATFPGGEGFLRSYVTMDFFACQPNIFNGLQSKRQKNAPEIRGAKGQFLAAKAADLAKNLPDRAEIKTHPSSLLV